MCSQKNWSASKGSDVQLGCSKCECVSIVLKVTVHILRRDESQALGPPRLMAPGLANTEGTTKNARSSHEKPLDREKWAGRILASDEMVIVRGFRLGPVEDWWNGRSPRPNQTGSCHREAWGPRLPNYVSWPQALGVSQGLSGTRQNCRRNRRARSLGRSW